MIVSASRYPMLSATLQKRILSGVYRDKLPTVRELVKEFNLSSQTVSMALRPLIAKGILKADRRRGTQIMTMPKEQSMIAIVSTGDMSIVEGDRKLKELQRHISEDGYESILFGITNKIGSRNVCKLLEEHFRGIIFTNSTLSYEVAEHLDQRKIPFVSCNRLPVYPHINYIEAGWALNIAQIAKDFAERGYRKQGLFFHGRLEGYNRIIMKEWRKIKEGLNLPRLNCDAINLDYRQSAMDMFRFYLEKLHEKKEPLDLLIIWGKLDEATMEMITEGPLRLPEDCMVLGYPKPGLRYPKQVIPFNGEDRYSELLFAAYDILREIMLAPTARKIHRSIELSLTYNYPKCKGAGNANTN